MQQPPDAFREEVWQGWRAVLPACAAVLPLGLALGVLVVQTGFAWWWGPVIALFIFAGSLEFLMVGMLAAVAPLSQIAVSALLVNFRHVFYAISFPLHRVHGRGWKVYSTYALTDEVYAVTADPKAQTWSRTRILSIQLIFQAVWVASVCAGGLLGQLIPDSVVGLDFAITALFVVLSIDAYRARRSIPVTILALGCALAGVLIAPGDMLIVSMALFVAALIGSYAVSRARSARA